MSTTTTTIDPEHRGSGRSRWSDETGGDTSSGASGWIDSGDRSRPGARLQGGASLSAADGMEAVSAGGRTDTLLAEHAEYLRRRAARVAIPRRCCPGAPAAGVRRKLRDGEADSCGLCDRCRDRQRARSAALRARWRGAGQCIQCGGPSPSAARCAGCQGLPKGRSGKAVQYLTSRRRFVKHHRS